MGRYGWAAMLLCTAIAVSGQHTERRFNVYGFADVTLSKMFLDETHVLWETGRGDALQFRLTHLNVYGDWKPNDFLRVLSEVAVLPYPHGTNERIGTIMEADVHITGSYDTTIASIDTVSYPRSPVNTEVVDDEDGPLAWGSIYLERAWMDFLFNQHLNLRIGKFITPSGIWNVDHGSPVLLTVRQPYQTSSIRIFPRAQIGMMGYGSLFLGDTDVLYSLYASTGRNEIDIEEATDVAVGGNLEAELPLLDGFSLGFSGYTGLRKTETVWRTISVSVEVPTHIRLVFDSTGAIDLAATEAATEAATDSAARAAVEEAALDVGKHAYGPVPDSRSREICLGLSGRLQWHGFTLQGECNYQQQRNHLEDDAQTHVIGYYGLLSYRHSLHPRVVLTPYVMVERISVTDAANNPQLLFDDVFFDGFTVVLGGLNCKLFTYATCKLEYGFMKMNTIGRFAEYEDLYDIHIVNAQFSVAF